MTKSNSLAAASDFLRPLTKAVRIILIDEGDVERVLGIRAVGRRVCEGQASCLVE